ncbi:PilX N-terminal domain-containing pilus assembly protein [Lysobacter sp. KIS68-7]|uniref:pilus assembly PilX family protein n=1 Tax=Lysobacter sp. KIS68-7 TaxID=2904252 RepID=UPI001E36B23A|nr:PilX N-terminal domain-containing pilus assembly protein [Lysobacter sp. KIS68-7]UHQ19276.1 PilX N-terminal domain-containing pilus assembly protein [Lysobacter sp. KIS68-7]
MSVRQRPQSQRGIALIVVLILLVVMSMLAIVSLRGTLLEERMSSNMTDRSLSFQAAEAALREGEALAATKPTIPASGCNNGVCARPLATDPPRWKDATVWAAARQGTALPNTARPNYYIEFLANDVPPRGTCTTTEDVSPDATCTVLESRYRITSRSQAAGRATVILQTTYAVP